MINEDIGFSKDQMMDALNQMSKSDKGIKMVKEVTTNMAHKIWMPVMRTMASALSKADDDKMKRMGNSLSKDVVQMDSSNNVTNLLTKTAEAIANVKKQAMAGCLCLVVLGSPTNRHMPQSPYCFKNNGYHSIAALCQGQGAP